MCGGWDNNPLKLYLYSFVKIISGIKKVLDSRPLEKLLPVDLVFPILYDKYSNDNVKRHFEPRDLIALTLKDHVCHPAKYRGQKNYSSDTGKTDLSTS